MSGIDRLDLGSGFFDCDVAEDLRPALGAPTFANDLASKPLDVDGVMKVCRELHERMLGKALQLQPTDGSSGHALASGLEILESEVTRDADTIHFKYVARRARARRSARLGRRVRMRIAAFRSASEPLPGFIASLRLCSRRRARRRVR